ncbi:MAG: hypothetical protein CMI31_15840 [Opitutae bacterium]|nr:hypothetical protein [Opitutae bacterium]
MMTRLEESSSPCSFTFFTDTPSSSSLSGSSAGDFFGRPLSSLPIGVPRSKSFAVSDSGLSMGRGGVVAPGSPDFTIFWVFGLSPPTFGASSSIVGASGWAACWSRKEKLSVLSGGFFGASGFASTKRGRIRGESYGTQSTFTSVESSTLARGGR